MAKNPIVGKTLRWTFDDGPMKDKSFAHTFAEDGSVSFRMLGGKSEEATRVEKCEIATAGEDVHAVSYLSDSGYTLTVVLDFSTGKLVAFASNEESLSTSTGTFEEADEEPERPKRSTARSKEHGTHRSH